MSQNIRGVCKQSVIPTHDNTGIVYMESPAVKTFMLGKFFDLWGERLALTLTTYVTSLHHAANGDGNPLYSWYEPQ